MALIDKSAVSKSLLNSPQPYTEEDLKLLWKKYCPTSSANVSNDPLYFLDDDCWGELFRESPFLNLRINYDPIKFKKFFVDFIIDGKYRSLSLTSPSVDEAFLLAADMLYIKDLEEMPLHINDEKYWEIAAWRLHISK